METKTTTSRVVIPEGQFFRERKDEIVTTVGDNPAEVSRTSTLGSLFRKADATETPSDRILEEATYEVLNLMLVEAATVADLPVVPAQEDSHCDTCCLPVRAKSVAKPKLEKAPVVAATPVVAAPVAVAAPVVVVAAKAKVSSKAKAKPVKKAKKSATKAKTKSKVVASGMSGQSGPSIDRLPMDDLNKKERKVMEFLWTQPSAKPAKILDIALGCFSTQPKPRRSSWVRNSLRRLARASLVERVDAGTYRLTAAGRRQVTKAA
jgi:hypothetical protein